MAVQETWQVHYSECFHRVNGASTSVIISEFIWSISKCSPGWFDNIVVPNFYVTVVQIGENA